MLTGTGRIIVAIAGAAALVVAGVFIVRGLLSTPIPQKNTAKTGSSSVGAPVPPPPGSTSTDPGANPAGPGEGPSDTGSPPNSGDGTTSDSAPPPPPPPPAFTATTQQTSTTIGQVQVDVALPQVQGGTPAVAQTFNSGMQSALQTQAGSKPKGTLKGDSKSGVRIGTQVLSGLLRTAYTPGTSSTPIALAATVVVDVKSNSALDLTSIFTDLNTGLKRLQTESTKLGPTSSTAGGTFSGTNVQADQTTFSHWTAESAGMKIYFEQGTVAPGSQGVVELIIPWTNLSDVLKPGVVETLSS